MEGAVNKFHTFDYVIFAYICMYICVKVYGYRPRVSANTTGMEKQRFSHPRNDEFKSYLPSCDKYSLKYL